ncbi:hypothetical protein DFA_08408 [Cavenderia fasciculata]|uniref:Protein SEY1 homolog n=1 Tax=Cavenderia fasciculata TaxID=261658 RepID=F4Q604_CACFS|nr:uncharacterized protein DFA_08408 [Cavenderia fasciculata]EGG17413.1 hypothetical protein DFA_08408 [Cavenderia fasciculata]|eukprot:XP_004355897.1 hypothetical protein DFA_08408 [Cavenderia fasciculata]
MTSGGEDITEEQFTEIVQFIDHNGDIVNEENDNKKSFLSCLSSKTDFLEKGFDYSVIAILGPQSSGKSTLLNILFNTKFAVMDSHTGRKQTTQGVWMGIANVESPETFLILDVEGTDGRERGEDEKAFERKTSLFSLVLSSVLIINMWAHDIGRYNAANIGLLKTVFELNLQLFQKSRDHDGETPLEKLRNTILEDIKNIWNELTKPKDFVNSTAHDFFNFEFTSLPHKVYSKDNFKLEAEVLKKKFLDPTNADFIPKKEYRNDIPADGFYKFSNNVWETIKANRDLDLPSQKEMLALFRCDEFVDQSFAQFSVDIAPLKEKIEKGRIVDNFGESTKKMVAACLERYDVPSARYHSETVSKKRQTLDSRLMEMIKTLFDKQIEKLYEKSVEFYKNLVQESSNIKKVSAASEKQSLESQLIPHFSVWSRNIRQNTLDYFEKIAIETVYPESGWSFISVQQELDDFIAKEISVLKENQLNKLSKFMKDGFFQQITPNLTKITEHAQDDMWKKITNLFNENLFKFETTYRKRLTDFDTKESDAEDTIEMWKLNTKEQLKEKIRDRAQLLPLRLKKRFEEGFTLDSRGLPRKWSKTDDIDSIYQEAMFNAEKLVDLFSYMRLQEEEFELTFYSKDTQPDDDDSLYLTSLKSPTKYPVNYTNIVLQNDQCNQIIDDFRKDTKTDLINARHEQSRTSSVGGVPPYMILLLCVLGFNEFIAILTNPLLFFLVVLLGVGFFVLHKLNLSGPFIDFSSTLLVSFMNKIKDVVLQVEHLSANHPESSDAAKKKKD